MCGIAGIHGRTGAESEFDALFSAIAHRGPDAVGSYRDDRLEMGMNRLRFRGADVPLPISNASGVSAYNGQVYGRFGQHGYEPVEAGLDREVAVAMFENRPDGMYAFSHYRPETGEVLLRTDPHFIKPMFFRRGPSGTAFCSELAPLLHVGQPNRIDIEALADLFAYGWYLTDRSWIRDVSLVCRNDVVLGDDGVRLSPKLHSVDSSRMADLTQLREAIRASVEHNMLGAGPIGLALSGGLDSTILAHELNALGVEDLTCITVLSREGEDRLESLAQLGLPAGGAWRSWQHVKVETDDDEFMAAFERSTCEFAQPTTMSSLPLYRRLADAAADAGVRALILGEGVDEYFAGYASYGKVHGGGLLDYYRHAPRELLTRTLFGDAAETAVRVRFTDLYDGAADLRAIEVEMRLSRLLLRSDVCLMARSIEGRVPFLHSNIPSLAMGLSWDEVIRDGGKSVLRRAYAFELGPRARVPKVRFKAPDTMLVRCAARPELRGRIIAGAGSVLGAARVTAALDLLARPASYDADTICLLLSLTFLAESGVLDDTRS